MVKPTQQQKINYIYDREKQKEYEECVESGTRWFLSVNCYTLEYRLANWNRLTKEYFDRTEEVCEKCQIKVYGKKTKTKN